MTYPPPPYADAVCGGFVAGEAIVGKWWAYPPQPGLLLGGYPPVLDILAGDEIPAAGLKLGAWVPTAAGQLYEIPPAGLRLGAVAPEVSAEVVLVVTPSGLVLGAIVPGYQLSTSPAPLAAGLLLGTYLPRRVGIRYLDPLECIEFVPIPDPETALVLAAASESSLTLDPVECR